MSLGRKQELEILRTNVKMSILGITKLTPYYTYRWLRLERGRIRSQGLYLKIPMSEHHHQALLVMSPPMCKVKL